MEKEKDCMEYFCPFFERQLETEENTETIVSDNMPDILYIMCADGSALIRSKNIDRGRVNVTGTVSACVVYCPDDDGGAVSTELSLPFSVTAEAEGLNEDCPAVVGVKLVGLEARMVNPRKIAVRARVELIIRAYRRDRLCFGEGELDDKGLQLRRESVMLKLPVELCEKNFVVAEEPELPVEIMPAQLLCRAVSVRAQEAKPVGSKLLVNGTAVLELLYGSGAGVEAESVELPFSQMLELSESHEGAEFDVTMLVSGLYAEVTGAGRLSVELHLVAQAAVCAEKRVSLLLDAYCPGKSLELTHDRSQPVCVLPKAETRHSVQMNLETPYVPVRIIRTRIRPTRAQVVNSDGTCRLRCTVEAAVLYSAENERCWQATANTELEFALERAVASDAAGELFVTGTPRAVPAAGGIALEFELAFVLRGHEVTELEYVSAASVGDALSAEGLPSYVITRAAGESLWDTAKRCCSTVELIRATNGIAEGETVERGRLLLIPRAI